MVSRDVRFPKTDDYVGITGNITYTGGTENGQFRTVKREGETLT